MQTLADLLAALVMGVASVELFSRAWLGFLGVLATGVLAARGELTWRLVPGRLNTHISSGLLCALLLVLAFHVYLTALRLGSSETEQLFFFLGCTARLLPLAFQLPAAVEALFELPEDS